MLDRTTTRFIFGLLLLAGVVILGFAWLMARREATPKMAVQRNIYDADIPVHARVPFDPRFILLTPYDCIKAPTADVFTSPLGSENAAFTYDAQTWGKQNARRGGSHWGVDLNGIGGENTDLGDPVYAAARGRVIYCGEPSEHWGNVIVLLHRMPDGSLLQTLYAHLDETLVRVGQTVPRGRIIGRVGNAHGNYMAHLHFETIPSMAVEAGMPAYGQSMGGRLNPHDVLNHQAPASGLPMPDPLPAIEEIQNELDMERMTIRFNPPEQAKPDRK